MSVEASLNYIPTTTTVQAESTLYDVEIERMKQGRCKRCDTLKRRPVKDCCGVGITVIWEELDTCPNPDCKTTPLEHVEMTNNPITNTTNPLSPTSTLADPNSPRYSSPPPPAAATAVASESMESRVLEEWVINKLKLNYKSKITFLTKLEEEGFSDPVDFKNSSDDMIDTLKAFLPPVKRPLFVEEIKVLRGQASSVLDPSNARRISFVQEVTCAPLQTPSCMSGDGGSSSSPSSPTSPVSPRTGRKKKVRRMSARFDPTMAPEDQYPLIYKKMNDPKLKLSSDESIELLSGCMRYGKSRAQAMVGKDAVVIIGNTGAGKSTLVNYTAGCTMQSVKKSSIEGLEGAGRVVIVKEGPGLRPTLMDIGHDSQSKTFLPHIETDLETGLTFCDCPGFLDNRGAEINIANAVNVRCALAKARSVKIIVLVNYLSLIADRGRGFSDLIEMCVQLFECTNELIKHKDCLLIGVSKVPPVGDDVASLEEVRAEFLNKKRPEIVNILADKVFIYDAIDRELEGGWNREKLLDEIESLSRVTNPSEIFKTVLNSEDELVLIDIAEKIGKTIKENLKAKKFLDAAGLLGHLDNLNTIRHAVVERLYKDIVDSIEAYFEQLTRDFKYECDFARFDDAEAILLHLEEAMDCFDAGVVIGDLEELSAFKTKSKEIHFEKIEKEKQAEENLLKAISEKTALESQLAEKDEELNNRIEQEKKQHENVLEEMKVSNEQRLNAANNSLEELKKEMEKRLRSKDEVIKMNQSNEEEFQRLKKERDDLDALMKKQLQDAKQAKDLQTEQDKAMLLKAQREIAALHAKNEEEKRIHSDYLELKRNAEALLRKQEEDKVHHSEELAAQQKLREEAVLKEVERIKEAMEASAQAKLDSLKAEMEQSMKKSLKEQADQAKQASETFSREAQKLKEEKEAAELAARNAAEKLAKEKADTEKARAKERSEQDKVALEEQEKMAKLKERVYKLTFNRAGFPMAWARDGSKTLYCGRFLGPRQIPGSDGRCGTSDGPQCSDCEFSQHIKDEKGGSASINRLGDEVSWGGGSSNKLQLFCGKRILTTSDICGLRSGAQCEACKSMSVVYASEKLEREKAAARKQAEEAAAKERLFAERVAAQEKRRAAEKRAAAERKLAEEKRRGLGQFVGSIAPDFKLQPLDRSMGTSLHNLLAGFDDKHFVLFFYTSW